MPPLRTSEAVHPSFLEAPFGVACICCLSVVRFMLGAAFPPAGLPQGSHTPTSHKGTQSEVQPLLGSLPYLIARCQRHAPTPNTHPTPTAWLPACHAGRPEVTARMGPGGHCLVHGAPAGHSRGGVRALRGHCVMLAQACGAGNRHAAAASCAPCLTPATRKASKRRPVLRLCAGGAARAQGLPSQVERTRRPGGAGGCFPAGLPGLQVRLPDSISSQLTESRVAKDIVGPTTLRSDSSSPHDRSHPSVSGIVIQNLHNYACCYVVAMP